jgi:ATP-dependent helicase/DNAse subunit B
MPVHLQRRLAEQQRSHRLMDVRLDRARTEEGLAQTNQPLVRMDMQPEKIREFAEPDRLEACDLHDVSPRCADCRANQRYGQPFSTPDSSHDESAHTKY